VLVALALIMAAAVSGSPAPTAAAGVVPNGFSDTVVIGGLSFPTDVAFAADGRVFVSEKSGLVKVFDSLSDPTPTVFADLRTNVHNFLDRGLLGLTLDPQFPARPYVYALYTYDALPGGTAPAWGTPGAGSDGCPDPPGATTDGCVVQARLSRLTADGDRMTGGEQVLVSGWCQQFPSHSIGTVAFGPDGALYASAGDGAGYNYADYGQTKNPCGDPPAPAGTGLAPPTAEGGSLRSQSVRRPAGQPVSLDGTIIRIDPSTGAGLPGNPFASSPDQNARRIVAYGLRNPFRFGFRPGTDELWAADVGWGAWEEIDRVRDINDGVAENFGWPCYEGADRQPGYDGADLNRCESLYPTASAHTRPFHTYHHNDEVAPGDGCSVGSSSISGIAFEDGSNYPAEYDGALFFADAARGCVWAMLRDGADPSGSRISRFVGGGGAIVKLLSGPGGDIFYVDLVAGQIRRVTYNGANHPPTAVVAADPTSGTAPLTVAFDGTGSVDLDAADQLTYAWDLDGDGQFDDSSAASPSFTYPSSGSVTVRLRVSDPAGASDTETVVITVGAPNSPPVPVIDTPTSALRWKVGDPISFSGRATDVEDGGVPASRLSWSVVLNHCPSNCHVHPLQDFAGVANGSLPAPDHEYPASLSLVLTAVDSAGASASTSIVLQPRTVDLTFATIPSGLSLAVGASTVTAPATRTVIVGSSNSVSAPGGQSKGGTSYGFDRWSDGGAATHNIVAPSTPATYTASYRTVTAGCPATPDFFHTIPSPTRPPAATKMPDGRIAFATVGSDGQTYLAAADITGDPVAVSALQCHGGLANDNPAVAAGSNFADLFVRAWDNTIWTRRLTSGGGSDSWHELPIGGATFNGPSAVVTAGDAVHLVVRGTNGGVFHAVRRGSAWTGWENLGGFIHGTPAVAARPGGGITIVVRGGDDAVWTMHGDTGAWSGWSSLGGVTTSSPTVAGGFAPDFLQLFVAGAEGGLWQGDLMNSAWSGWYQIEGSLSASARLAAAATTGRVIVYVSQGGAGRYLQYVDQWIGYKPSAYTCASCVPATRGSGSVP
jgi:glucose/arabinose dehydrogenase